MGQNWGWHIYLRWCGEQRAILAAWHVLAMNRASSVILPPCIACRVDLRPEREGNTLTLHAALHHALQKISQNNDLNAAKSTSMTSPCTGMHGYRSQAHSQHRPNCLEGRIWWRHCIKQNRAYLGFRTRNPNVYVSLGIVNLRSAVTGT